MNRYAVSFRHQSITEIVVEVVPYEDSLQEMYRLCDCDTIDIVTLVYYLPQYKEMFEYLTGVGERICVVIDDNGKIFSKPPTIPLCHDHRVYDVFNGDLIVIIGHENGETYGFGEDQAYKVMRQIQKYLENFKSPLTYIYKYPGEALE